MLMEPANNFLNVTHLNFCIATLHKINQIDLYVHLHKEHYNELHTFNLKIQ